MESLIKLHLWLHHSACWHMVPRQWESPITRYQRRTHQPVGQQKRLIDTRNWCKVQDLCTRWNTRNDSLITHKDYSFNMKPRYVECSESTSLNNFFFPFLMLLDSQYIGRNSRQQFKNFLHQLGRFHIEACFLSVREGKLSRSHLPFQKLYCCYH